MKKLIHSSLISLALASAAFNANASVEKDMIAQPTLSYACKTMQEHGSNMFCGDAVDTVKYAKAAISELAYVESGSYACGAMAARGSAMFCQQGKSAISSAQANN